MTALAASSADGFFDKNDDPEDGSVFDPTSIGLSFSGGGYRATLFHAGALVRLNELGLMRNARTIASVSGGSITTAVLAMNWDKLEFEGDVATPLSMRQQFLRPILKATSKSIDVWVGIQGLLPFLSGGNRLAAAYDKNLFDGFRLKNIAEAPEFVFCATNLQTGGLFKFRKNKLTDWRTLEASTHNVRLSEAVAASSAFPPVLAPVRLGLGGETVKTHEIARYDDKRLHKRPVLVDGGVYDNLGLEGIWKQCGVIFSSYAGKNMDAEPGNFNIDIMMPVVFRFLEYSIDWRERVLINMFRHKLADGLKERAGAYWAAEKMPQTSPNGGWLPDDVEDVFKTVNGMGTRLKQFDRKVEKAAMLAGYLQADVNIRRWALPDAEPPIGPPEAMRGF